MASRVKPQPIGPRLPGGAFQASRTRATKIGRCSLTRRYTRHTKWSLDEPSQRRIAYTLDCGQRRRADLEIIHSPNRDAYWRERLGLARGVKVWRVSSIDTEAAAQRKGLATRLYEEAAKHVCARGGVLISNNRLPGAKSQDFWWKQVQKGRARRVGEGEFVHASVVLDCAHAGDLSGVAKRRRVKRKQVKRKPVKRKTTKRAAR